MQSPFGRFTWVDLSSSDPTAAISFYTQVVGWTVTPVETDDGPYPMWTGAQPVGGLVPLPPHVRAPNWLPYVSTSDLEDTVARVKELGGHVLQPVTAIGRGMGWFAVFRDPQGAAFAAHQPEGAPRPRYDGPPRPGDVPWRELATTDVRGASSFYEALFDWQLGDTMDLGDGRLYQLVVREGAIFAGIYEQPAGDAIPAWLVYFSVVDVRAAVNRVRALGGTLESGPMQVPTGDLVATCVDPQGARFALHQVGPG